MDNLQQNFCSVRNLSSFVILFLIIFRVSSISIVFDGTSKGFRRGRLSNAPVMKIGFEIEKPHCGLRWGSAYPSETCHFVEVFHDGDVGERLTFDNVYQRLRLNELTELGGRGIYFARNFQPQIVTHTIIGDFLLHDLHASFRICLENIDDEMTKTIVFYIS